MEVNCAGCAGCCIDWRPLVDGDRHTQPGAPGEPLDDRYNLVPLSRDDVRSLVGAGYGAALRPRLWRADPDQDSVDIDGYEVVAIRSRPLFMMGLRHVPKPVAPFGTEPHWLRSCVFLDPDTLQCRIHDEPEYPTTCATYPGDHLTLDAESECERVEANWDETRLVDGTPPENGRPPPLDEFSLGSTVFLHPDPSRLAGRIERLLADSLQYDDRFEFGAVALAQSPGMPETQPETYRSERQRLDEQESWIRESIEEWMDAAVTTEPEPSMARSIEDRRGAPSTPGWDGE